MDGAAAPISNGLGLLIALSAEFVERKPCKTAIKAIESALATPPVLLPFAFGIGWANEYAATNAWASVAQVLRAQATGQCVALWVTDVRSEIMDVKTWGRGDLMPVLTPGADVGPSYYFDDGYKVRCRP